MIKSPFLCVWCLAKSVEFRHARLGLPNPKHSRSVPFPGDLAIPREQRGGPTADRSPTARLGLLNPKHSRSVQFPGDLAIPREQRGEISFQNPANCRRIPTASSTPIFPFPLKSPARVTASILISAPHKILSIRITSARSVISFPLTSP